MMVTINCDVCGKPFAPKRSDATTCSSTCRSRKSRAAQARLGYLEESYWSLHRAVNASTEKLTTEEADVLRRIQRTAREKLLNASHQATLPWHELVDVDGRLEVGD